MKTQCLMIVFLFTSLLVFGQKIETMQWLNEPEKWEIRDGNLSMDVTPKSDYWRVTYHDFIVDDGPFYYTTRGGEFEVTVKIKGAYKSKYDQMGLMLRINEEQWIKTGIEYVDGIHNYSTVVTNKQSNWSVIQLDEKPNAVWIKAIRQKDAVEIYYSLDGENFKLSNQVYLAQYKPVMVGMMAASPDGDGFKALFEDFTVKHLPDLRRLEWLNNNQE